MIMCLWALGSVLYVAVAVMCFRFLRKTKQHISESKHYRRHPEQMEEFGGTITDVVVSALWPLQVIGFLFYGMKG